MFGNKINYGERPIGEFVKTLNYNVQLIKGDKGDKGDPFTITSSGYISTVVVDETDYVHLENAPDIDGSITDPVVYLVTTDNRTDVSTSSVVPAINVVGTTSQNEDYNVSGHLIVSFDYVHTTEVGTWIDYGQFTGIKGDKGDGIQIHWGQWGYSYSQWIGGTGVPDLTPTAGDVLFPL